MDNNSNCPSKNLNLSNNTSDSQINVLLESEKEESSIRNIIINKLINNSEIYTENK